MASSVSVIIPAYRITQYVAEAIDSAERQTCIPDEIIVVNDGCPDSGNLEKVLQPYIEGGRIKYIRQENQGPSAARNTGLQSSAGQLLVVLDGDDRLRPRALEIWIAKMRESPNAGMLYGNATFYGGTRLDGQELMTNYPSRAPVVTFSDLVTRQSNSFACAMFRREALFDIGLYDESLRKAEDYDIALRMARSCASVENTKELVYDYRVRPDGLAQSGGDLRKWRVRVLEKHREMPGLSAEEKRLLNGELRYQYAEMALDESRVALRNADYARARDRLRAARQELKSSRLALVSMALRIAPGALRQFVLSREKPRSQSLT